MQSLKKNKNGGHGNEITGFDKNPRLVKGVKKISKKLLSGEFFIQGLFKCYKHYSVLYWIVCIFSIIYNYVEIPK